MAMAHALTTSLAAVPTLCATTFLPVDGILNLGIGLEPLTLTEPAIFHRPCPTIEPRAEPTHEEIELPSTDDILNDSSLSQHDDDKQPPQSNWREPFYTSPFPLAYALAATTITSYMLVIMLFITPRSFLDGGIVYLGRRGFTNSSASGVTIGGRPWLQKVAALTVAMSLTVATADTFEAAEEQWDWGISNAKLLQDKVMGSTELKVIRLVSDTFLWLAQAQTLIRLFPRQKEKIIIKWAAFALITLDVVFSALNSFMYSDDGVTSRDDPRDFVDAIPALSYIFQLSLGILYAAWVIYYALMRKKYAFYHPLMRNICLVAIISIVAILIPIVFFILDISKPDVAGWGDYVRWVGAAAASVVVWEWVERIEALEREDKKDGILGREVFDDEVDFTSSRYIKRQKPSQDESSTGSGGGDDDGAGEPRPQTPQRPRQTGITWAGTIANRQWSRPENDPGNGSQRNQQSAASMLAATRQQFWPSRPAPAVTPVSRTDTTSAASTVYAVRFAEGERRYTPDAIMQQTPGELTRHESVPRSSQHTSDETVSSRPAQNSSPTPAPVAQRSNVATPAARQTADIEAMEAGMANRGPGWRSLGLTPGPVFSRASTDAPPAVVAQHAIAQEPKPAAIHTRARNLTGRWDIAGRLEEFAVSQAEKFREKVKPQNNTDSLPVLRIPAPPRAGAALQQVLEEEELQQNQPRQGQQETRGSSSPPGQSDDQRQARALSSRGGSDDRPDLSRSRSAYSTGSRGQDAPLPPNNPPLWPGVQPRYLYDDEEGDGYTDSDLVSQRSSLEQSQSHSQSHSQSRSSERRSMSGGSGPSSSGQR
ncbi:palH/RIM21 domain-containing protein [Sarocladium implicatum]|nr:palH/RIM21 domain-containing protein [Sarocladium implicatum]